MSFKYCGAQVQPQGLLSITAPQMFGIQHVAPVDEFPVEKWYAILAINLSSAFHTTRLALEPMRRQGFGRIVTSTSSGVVAPMPGRSAGSDRLHDLRSARAATRRPRTASANSAGAS